MSPLPVISFCSATEGTKYAAQYKVRMMHYELRSSVLRSVACTSLRGPDLWKPRTSHSLGKGASLLLQPTSPSRLLVINDIGRAVPAARINAATSPSLMDLISSCLVEVAK